MFGAVGLRGPRPALFAAIVGGVCACGSAAPSSSPTAGSSPALFPDQHLPAGSAVVHLTGVTGQSAGAVALASAGGTIWASDGLFQIDARTLKVSPGLDTSPNDDDSAVIADATSVWGADFNANVVRRFDIASGKPIAAIPVDSADGLAEADDGSVWVTSHHQGTVVHISAVSNTVIGSVSLTSPGVDGPQGVATGDGAVWVGAPKTSAVYKVDQRSGAVLQTIAFGGAFNPCGDIEVTQTSVWLSECLEGTHIARIDPSTGRVVAIIDTKGNVESLAPDGTAVWFVTTPDQFSSTPDAYLEEVTESGTVEHKVVLGEGFATGGVRVTQGAIWVSTPSAPIVLRIPDF